MSVEYSQNLSSNKIINTNLCTYSNNGSIDIKQRRKRKLEKPLKIPINLNLTYQNAEHNEMKSLFNKSLQTEQFEFGLEKKKELVTDLSQNYDYFEKNNRNLKRKTVFRKLENFNASITSNFPNDRVFENRHQIKSNILLFQSSQKKKIITRTRRNSDTCVRITSKVPKVRRKSCDNSSYFIRESIPHRYDANNTVVFNEVESQLEKMFAGIIEGDTNVLKNKGVVMENNIVSNRQSTLNDKSIGKDELFTNHLSNIPSNVFTVGNELNLRTGKKKNANSTKKYLHAQSESSVKNKKKRLSYTKCLKSQSNINKKKNNRIDNFRDPSTEAYNSHHAKYRGPIIQMKNSHTNTARVEIINFPREEDEEKNKEKRRSLNNCISSKSKRLNRHQNNLDYRGNLRTGELFNSTLSSRYDACTTDSTWICIFCKKGPHFLVESSNCFENSIPSGSGLISTYVLSDLFGPFSVVKSITESDLVVASNNMRQVINGPEKQHNKKKCGNKYPVLISQLIQKSKRKKKYFPEEKKDTSMDISVSNLIADCCEVWIHEQCIIWSVGVYITGGRLNGLQDAVRDSMVSVCTFCGITGANIKCLSKGCKFVVHYCCAINSGWHLNVREYISKCNIHKQ